MITLEFFDPTQRECSALKSEMPSTPSTTAVDDELLVPVPARGLDLASDEVVELFGVWHDHYSARIDLQRAKAFENISAFIAEEAPKHRGTPFVCVCGEECDPLGDLNFGRIHVGRTSMTPLRRDAGRSDNPPAQLPANER